MILYPLPWRMFHKVGRKWHRVSNFAIQQNEINVSLWFCFDRAIFFNNCHRDKKNPTLNTPSFTCFSSLYGRGALSLLSWWTQFTLFIVIFAKPEIYIQCQSIRKSFSTDLGLQHIKFTVIWELHSEIYTKFKSNHSKCFLNMIKW